VKISKEKEHMARNTQGIIPDDHFENDPGPRPKNKTPLSKEWLRLAAS
jgi:hypothetical protein